MQMRLDKFISEGAGISRAQARKLIIKGCVTVDGVTAKKIDAQTSQEQEVKINGDSVFYEEFVYIMLNKPLGVVSASKDKNDVTVTDLVAKDFPKRELFPAGRLDKQSEGFVLITDDGKFAHDILSPKHHVPKTYIVTLDAPVTPLVIEAFEKGVELADGQVMKCAEIKILENDTTAQIILHQGVYHQIKRMLGVFDIGVNTLYRTTIGNLSMPADLASGKYIKLTKKQVEMIAPSMFTEN
ncbi:MAG: pseudouridine synthase [Oscillospiraceae bacterium]